jgi:hypothetical protein
MLIILAGAHLYYWMMLITLIKNLLFGYNINTVNLTNSSFTYNSNLSYEITHNAPKEC